MIFSRRKYVEAGQWYEVEVTIEGETFIDAIHERNEELALEKANWNWEYSSDIKLTGKIITDFKEWMK